MANATWQVDTTDAAIPYRGVDGTVLQASTTDTTDTDSTGVFTGKGLMCIELIVTALVELPTGADRVIFHIESNTKAATSTWLEIANHTIGDVLGAGRALGTGTYAIYVNNQQDNQLRIGTELYSSTSSVTWSAKVYPLRRRVLA